VSAIVVSEGAPRCLESALRALSGRAPITHSHVDSLRRELRTNLRLALPLIAAQLAFVSMGTVDAIFAGRLGVSELAAVAVGSNVWFLTFVMFMGVAMAVSPIVAQRLGAGWDPDGIGEFLRGAMLLAVVLGLAWLILLLASIRPVLSLLDLDARTAGFAREYLFALSWSALPLSLCFFLRNGAEGHGLTRVTLAAGLTGLAVNAGFNWLLMYGNWGFPRLGPAGCGWATTIASWTMVASYLLSYRRHQPLRALRLFRRGMPRIEAQTFEVLRVGLPVAAILAAEAWLFCIGALLMARFGADAVAAHQIAINFASLCFMVPTAIGMATTVRVGHAAGAGDHAAAAVRGRAGIALGVAFAMMSAAAMALAPGVIVGVYTDAAHLAAPAARFLAFAAVFQVFDCVQATANGALRGLKDTRVPMTITLFAYWGIGMPLAVGLAFGTPAGPAGIWYGFIAGLAIAAIGLGWRFLGRTRAVATRVGG
jgi:multidrug resistance protein, MATE family